MNLKKLQKISYEDNNNNRIYETHKNKEEINKMYNLINDYAKTKGINLKKDDAAEWFIDYLTKYIDESN